MSKEDSELTDKQERFVVEYVRDFNATRAAIAAGYSVKTAASIGSENLRKPEIRDRIREMIEATADDLRISRASVVAELGRYAFKSRDGAHTDVSNRDAIQALIVLAKHVGLFGDAPNNAKAEYELAFEAAAREIERERNSAKRDEDVRRDSEIG